MHNILKIPNTLKVVANCWHDAERSLQIEIREFRPGLNEEGITETFHGELAKKLKLASDQRRIEQAFLADLNNAFPDSSHSYELDNISRGLIASVALHKRETEVITGGDIGFVIARPQIEDSSSSLRISDYRRGILGQAKIRRANGRWGEFTPTQCKILPERLSYLAILLYDYRDKERRLLKDFQWLLCHYASSLDEVKKWLQIQECPSLVESKAIVERLGQGLIGTDDGKVLNEIIGPPKSTLLKISIGWPKGDHPGSVVHVISRHHQQIEIRQ